MNRISTLPGGCKNLSDTVHIVALEGQEQRPPMTLAAAQKLASDLHAELIHISRGPEPSFMLVDTEMRRRVDTLDVVQMLSEVSRGPDR